MQSTYNYSRAQLIIFLLLIVYGFCMNIKNVKLPHAPIF